MNKKMPRTNFSLNLKRSEKKSDTAPNKTKLPQKSDTLVGELVAPKV